MWQGVWHTHCYHMLQVGCGVGGTHMWPFTSVSWDSLLVDWSVLAWGGLSVSLFWRGQSGSVADSCHAVMKKTGNKPRTQIEPLRWFQDMVGVDNYTALVRWPGPYGRGETGNCTFALSSTNTCSLYWVGLVPIWFHLITDTLDRDSKWFQETRKPQNQTTDKFYLRRFWVRINHTVNGLSGHNTQGFYILPVLSRWAGGLFTQVTTVHIFIVYKVQCAFTSGVTYHEVRPSGENKVNHITALPWQLHRRLNSKMHSI